MFYMTYIQLLNKKTNAFAEFGSFGHELLEKYFKKELEFFELSSEYIKNYESNIKSKFPPNPHVDLNETYYKSGKEYFNNFEGLYDNAKILGVEKEIKVKIGKYNFIGFIDLILKDENGIIIIDHKSKKFKTKKEKEEYLIQLYLYSIYVFEKYGVYPYKLIFNMFRINSIIEEIFDIDKFEKSKLWVENTIDEIYKDTEFKTNYNSFFCDWICSVNFHCPCSNRYLGK